MLLIDANISNPNFSVEELSSEMFVSRYTLYKKILQMTGKTPNELVRSMRLKYKAPVITRKIDMIVDTAKTGGDGGGVCNNAHRNPSTTLTIGFRA